ncbi:hypothetical protein WKR88_21150 [Trinickia caryophylli]|uniref:Uncharacterized protein n=1 Tax=Trinickia caryophylli TaxID=28094 RepID=A0A1X7DMQ0_TRICW|nr:hypothetical protein [Trinickia caryophylli]PMS10638.1 hypothetical protein C0Z17_18650 [Trinickia caryophylli]TRX17179.1 hypothetical protein FNF07_02300 [Trinickia caryophylli]WQE12086.1 hypothetical protein U0034_01260 [Trinickia caryophylli]SMF18343.1 hypothetical protein SAMN06295900_103423 [Trinickia caryophylli]
MNQSSERLVVFVTAAQKRAIATKAASLGISVSELLRRAVLAYGETAEEVRAARIVDSWRAPAPPDGLSDTLRRIAAAAGAPVAAPVESHDRADAPDAASRPAGQPGQDAEQSAPGSVAAAVAQALAELPPNGESDEGEDGNPDVDVQTVARVTANWWHGATAAEPDEPAGDGKERDTRVRRRRRGHDEP